MCNCSTKIIRPVITVQSLLLVSIVHVSYLLHSILFCQIVKKVCLTVAGGGG